MTINNRAFTLIRTRLRRNLVNIQSGFTLIELLVVISIMGILIGLTLFGIGGARESSRDAKRKADLELIRSGIEIYRADCNKYPTSLSDPLIGNGSSASCDSANTYISSLPKDPVDPTRNYKYYSADGSFYEICASLEQPQPSPFPTCSGAGTCGTTCNYKVTNP